MRCLMDTDWAVFWLRGTRLFVSRLRLLRQLPLSAPLQFLEDRFNLTFEFWQVSFHGDPDLFGIHGKQERSA